MNGWEMHGLTHSSASAINMWADAPHMWVASYLFNRKGIFSPAAKVGVLCEDAVRAVIAQGIPRDDAVKAAMNEYAKFTALGCSDADVKRGEGLPGMIDGAIEALKPYGKPTFETDLFGKLQQRKVEILCKGDGFELPVIGYTDFIFEEAGVCIDLKTSMRLASELSDSHRRQASIYQHALGNIRVSFLYVTPKKTNIIECPDVTSTLTEIKGILNRQNKFLASGDAQHLRQIVPVVESSYYHDDTISQELFGI